MKNKVAHCTQEALDYILKNIREEDRLELLDAYGLKPEEVFNNFFEKQAYSWVAYDAYGIPFMLFGAGYATDIDGYSVGIPFMIATKEIKNNKRTVLEVSKPYLDKIKNSFKYLVNWIPSDSKKSIKWLTWCGFIMQERANCGYNKNREFIKFYMKGGVC